MFFKCQGKHRWLPRAPRAALPRLTLYMPVVTLSQHWPTRVTELRIPFQFSSCSMDDLSLQQEPIQDTALTALSLSVAPSVSCGLAGFSISLLAVLTYGTALYNIPLTGFVLVPSLLPDRTMVLEKDIAPWCASVITTGKPPPHPPHHTLGL